MAILAGDALLVEAFNLMTKNNLICEKLILRAMRELTDAIGIKGLVAGEVMDIISEKQKPDQKTLEFIHYHKTAKFIQSCVKIGGILAGTNEEELSALSDYGKI